MLVVLSTRMTLDRHLATNRQAVVVAIAGDGALEAEGARHAR